MKKKNLKRKKRKRKVAVKAKRLDCMWKIG